MAEDASSKKFLVSNFINYKMTDSRPVLEQYNELLGILKRFTQHKMNMDESIQVSCIIDKLSPSWKDFKHTLKYLKMELTRIELGSHLRIEEPLRAQDNDKPKGNNVAGPLAVNMVEHNNSSRIAKLVMLTTEPMDQAQRDLRMDDDVAWWVDSGAIVHVCKDRCWFKTYESLNDGSILHIRNESTTLVHGRGCIDLRFSSGKVVSFDMCDQHATPSLGNKKYFVTFIDDASRSESRVLGAVVRLPDPKLKTLGERGIECIFVGYAEHSNAFRFYVIEPNNSVAINFIIESRDGIFDEHRFSSVPRPSQRSLVKGTEDSGGSVVPEKEQGMISDQHSYCFNIEDDPKTFDEAMKSQDVAFWKKAINDEMDSIMGNNTWVLTDLPPGCKPLGCKWIFKRNLKVDGTVEKFKAMLVIQGFKQKSGIDYFDTYAPVARISIIRLLIALASIHSLIIHQMDVKTAFLNGELEEEVYMNQPLGFIMPGNENKAISQSHYIEKVLKKFNYSDCTPISTPLDTYEKLMPNKGLAVSQLEYSSVIGCLMYVMTCTRPDIAFILVLEGYTDARWISNIKDNLSTSGWVFLLGGGAISWASKKQTCITGSTIESEFVPLAATGKEAE
ncbi:zinc finger, CCHC-type containing protein [Tanacetum coccineum]|uniref:Zinc finger, CCHC-type containing protein n=1 Tax=Tanacetum coccineum TaxID=301880 RepID=A0ABQ5IDF4_9ASTR